MKIISEIGINHGSYTVFEEKDERMSNLLLSMLHKLDIEKESFSDSTGKLSTDII